MTARSEFILATLPNLIFWTGYRDKSVFQICTRWTRWNSVEGSIGSTDKQPLTILGGFLRSFCCRFPGFRYKLVYLRGLSCLCVLLFRHCLRGFCRGFLSVNVCTFNLNHTAALHSSRRVEDEIYDILSLFKLIQKFQFRRTVCCGWFLVIWCHRRWWCCLCFWGVFFTLFNRGHKIMWSHKRTFSVKFEPQKSITHERSFKFLLF